jgi:hypothetical protein
VACEDAKNHGEYVSSIARTTPKGEDRGRIVSEAAKSDCGKSDGAKPTADDEAEDDDEPKATPSNKGKSSENRAKGKAKKERGSND